MNFEYIKLSQFYLNNKEIIEKEDRDQYFHLCIRHYIYLGVGLSLAPISMSMHSRIRKSLPPYLAMPVTLISALGPVAFASYYSRKHNLTPHLEYIFKKYSPRDQDFNYLIENPGISR